MTHYQKLACVLLGSLVYLSIHTDTRARAQAGCYYKARINGRKKKREGECPGFGFEVGTSDSDHPDFVWVLVWADSSTICELNMYDANNNLISSKDTPSGGEVSYDSSLVRFFRCGVKPSPSRSPSRTPTRTRTPSSTRSPSLSSSPSPIVISQPPAVPSGQWCGDCAFAVIHPSGYTYAYRPCSNLVTGITQGSTLIVSSRSGAQCKAGASDFDSNPSIGSHIIRYDYEYSQFKCCSVDRFDVTPSLTPSNTPSPSLGSSVTPSRSVDPLASVGACGSCQWRFEADGGQVLQQPCTGGMDTSGILDTRPGALRLVQSGLDQCSGLFRRSTVDDTSAPESMTTLDTYSGTGFVDFVCCIEASASASASPSASPTRTRSRTRTPSEGSSLSRTPTNSPSASASDLTFRRSFVSSLLFEPEVPCQFPRNRTFEATPCSDTLEARNFNASTTGICEVIRPMWETTITLEEMLTSFTPIGATIRGHATSTQVSLVDRRVCEDLVLSDLLGNPWINETMVQAYYNRSNLWKMRAYYKALDQTVYLVCPVGLQCRGDSVYFSRDGQEFANQETTPGILMANIFIRNRGFMYASLVGIDPTIEADPVICTPTGGCDFARLSLLNRRGCAFCPVSTDCSVCSVAQGEEDFSARPKGDGTDRLSKGAIIAIIAVVTVLLAIAGAFGGYLLLSRRMEYQSVPSN